MGMREFFDGAVPGAPSTDFTVDKMFKFFSGLSNLTPASRHSMADHQYSFLCSELGLNRDDVSATRSLVDLWNAYYTQLGIAAGSTLQRTNAFYSGSWENGGWVA